MSTYQCVISVRTVLLKQYIIFNILRLQLSRRRPEAIRGRINVLRQKTVTALLSLDTGSLFSLASPSVSGAVAAAHSALGPSVFDCRSEVTLPHTYNLLCSQHFHFRRTHPCGSFSLLLLLASPCSVCLSVSIMRSNPAHQLQWHISPDNTFISSRSFNVLWSF